MCALALQHAEHSDVPLPHPSLRVLEVDFRTDRRWKEFISCHPDALIYHHPGWLSALENEFGQKCIGLACEDDRGSLKAILPLIYTRGLPLKFGRIATGRRLCSLPRTPVAGPLALNQEAAVAIVEHAVERARSENVQLEIKTSIGNLDQSIENLSCMPWRATYVEELPPVTEGEPWERFWETLRVPRPCISCEGCRKLRFGNARRQHRINWSVNKAIRMGLSVREAETEDELHQWYGLYLLTMREIAVPPRPYRLFRSLWYSLRPSRNMLLLLAIQGRSGQERTVAGSIFLQYSQTVFYAFTGCAPKDFHLHPHDILQLEAIRAACRSGFRWYDFGEVAEENDTLAQFKTKWGGDPMPLFRYYDPAPVEGRSKSAGKITASARRIWRSLPPKATEVLGDLIYRRM